jgi:hypothetical protein
MTGNRSKADEEFDARTMTGLPRATCLRCGTKHDNATNLSAPFAIVPQPGNIAVCCHCAYAQAYTDKAGRFRELTRAERRSRIVRRAVQVMQRVLARRPN